MLITKCDQKGRIYLREAIRSRYGEKFLVVETADGLILLSLPHDPVADLSDLGQALAGCTLLEARERIRRRAVQEAAG